MFGFCNVSERSVPRRATTVPLLGLAVWLAWLPVFAVEIVEVEGQIDWLTMAITLFGGLALFLFGMDQMAEALKQVAGDSMKRILARLTGSRTMGLITGAFVTAVIQSSSVTTVMLVGFVTASLMTLPQAIGVILGADIGTTITAQIVAFKVEKYALLLVAVGFLIIFTGKTDEREQYGHLIMGLGLIFFGMGVMSAGMEPLRSYEPFILLMQEVSNPIIGILLAAAFTGLVQSSSATMGVVIALSLQGLLTLEAGIALALGANIGTCVTAGLAAIGKPPEAVRVAVAHVTFKIVGVLLIIPFLPAFADFIREISPSAPPDLTGADRMAAVVPRQIANAHTVFNVGIAVLFLPLANFFARFCEWVVPDRPARGVTIVDPLYLDEPLISTPALALDRVRMEIGHVGEHVERMVDRMMPTILTGDQAALEEIAKLDDAVDILHGKIVTYLGRVSRQSLSDHQSHEFTRLMEAVNDVENIGDIIETDLVALGHKRIDENVTVSDATQRVLAELHEAVAESVRLAMRGLVENDERAARDVIAMKSEINRLVDAAAAHQTSRLVADEPNRLAAYSVEIDVVEKLKRIYYFAKRIAKASVPVELTLRAE